MNLVDHFVLKFKQIVPVETDFTYIFGVMRNYILKD